MLSGTHQKFQAIQDNLTNIQGDEPSVTELNVIDVDLQLGDFQSIADVLAKSPQVRKLVFRHCEMTEQALKVLLPVFLKLPNLDCVEISISKIGDAGALLLADFLKNKASLQSLFLAENAIGDQGTEGLANALTTHSSLLTLCLANNSIGSKGVKALGEALSKNTLLDTLRVNSALTPEGMEAFIPTLAQNKTLESLYMDPRDIPVSSAVALATAVKNHPKLKLLSLVDQPFNFEVAKALAELDAPDIDNPTVVLLRILRHIRINKSETKGAMLNLLDIEDISDFVFHELSQGLKTNTVLGFLTLQEGTLTSSKFAKELAAGLKANKSLTGFDIEDSSLNDNFVVELASVLKENANLEQFGLCNTPLSDQSVAVLAEALKINRGLKKLKLTSLSEQQLKPLLAVLNTNPSLESVELEIDPLYYPAIVEIMAMLQKNQTLKTFSLSTPLGPIDPAISNLINAALEENLANCFSRALESADTLDSKDANLKTQFIAALTDLKDKTIQDYYAGKLSADRAKTLAGYAENLVEGGKLDAARIKTFAEETKDFRTTWSWRVILGAVIGAAVGFVLGAVIGAAAGPGALLTAIAGGAQGAIIGAALFGAAGAAAGGGVGFWRERKQDPLEKMIKAAQAVVEPVPVRPVASK